MQMNCDPPPLPLRRKAALSYTTDCKLQEKASMAQATSLNRTKGQKSLPTRETLEPSLAKFVRDPVKGADSLLRLRHKDAIASVLAHPEFASALRSLTLSAMQSAPAAVSLSRLALNPAFSTAATAAIAAHGDWPDPTKFEAPHRRLAAEALERTRPLWALSWIVKALLSALPYADLRRFFMSRLILAAGSLQGAVFALGNSLSALEPKGKRPSNFSTLVEELRNCANPANPVSAGANTFVALFQAIAPDRLSKGDAKKIKRQLIDLIRLAAAADRALLLEEPFLALAATLDADLAATLRAEAKRLFSQIVTEPPPPPPIPPHAELIREAAWSEADEALGRALQDTGRLLRSFERLESVVDGEAANHTRRAKGASDLVLQWVRQAARQRTIMPLGSVGDRVTYDPVFHDLDADAVPGDVVRLVKPPIVRGSDEQQVVLIRGEVELD
jgi:hypothetical protein